jgi:hypothetical protein
MGMTCFHQQFGTTYIPPPLFVLTLHHRCLAIFFCFYQCHFSGFISSKILGVLTKSIMYFYLSCIYALITFNAFDSKYVGEIYEPLK